MIITIQKGLSVMWQDQWSCFLTSINRNGCAPEANCLSCDFDLNEVGEAQIFGAVFKLPQKLFQATEWKCWFSEDYKGYTVFGINDLSLAVCRSGEADPLPSPLRDVACIALSYVSPSETIETLAVVNPERLTTLHLAFCDLPTALELQSLKSFKSLTHLCVQEHKMTDETDDVTDLSSLLGSKHLKSLSLSGGICQKLKTIEPLTKLPELSALALFDCPAGLDLKPLTEVPALDELALSGCISRSNLSVICEIIQLACLSLNVDESFKDVSPLSALKNLRSLVLNGCSELADISQLTALQGLEEFHLFGCQSLTNLVPLAELQKLESLLLFQCSASDITALTRLSNLRKLVLSGCKNITDISSLSGMKNLKELHRVD